MKTSLPRPPLIRALRDALLERPGHPVQIRPGRQGEADLCVTAEQLWSSASRLAWFLQDRGLRPGEPVLLLSENHERWLVADLALQGLGCPGVPRGTDAPAGELEYIVRKVRARAAIVESPAALRHLPHEGLEGVLLLTGRAPADTPWPVIHYGEAMARAPEDLAARWFEAEVMQRHEHETATIVFTSGTTGQPKGVVLTQANLAANLEQLRARIDFLRPTRTFVSILPPWHMFERMVEYALLCLGLQIVYSDRRHFAADLARFEPDVLATVPRVWVLLMDGLQARLKDQPRRRRLLVGMALRLGTWWARTRRFLQGRLPRFPDDTAGQRLRRVGSAVPGLLAAPLYWLLARPVLQGLARKMGLGLLCERGAAISGGGSLPAHVDLFYDALGVRMLNGYGLTETSPVLALRLPERNVAGTVGGALPWTELTLRDPDTGAPVAAGRPGVIFARGPQVMSGYFEDAAATAAVLGEDGWFNTGDLGRFTVHGELAITGRAKDTIVLLSGENIDPEPLEDALLESPFIHQAVVVGQDQKFLGALIVPAPGQPMTPATAQGIVASLRREIDGRVNPRRGFRPHERIVRFALLERPFCVEDGSMSATLKIKRNVIQERLSGEIQSLFQDPRRS